MAEPRFFLLLLGLAWLLFFGLALVSRRTRFPTVLLLMVAGALVGKMVGEMESLHWLSQVGIVFLFFLLGLDFPLKRVGQVSRKIWPAGLLDVGLNLGGAVGLVLALGHPPKLAFLLGVVAYATSSAITIQMLEEAKRLTYPEAEFMLALLIFEDLIGPFMVSLLAALLAASSATSWSWLTLLFKLAFLTGAATLIGGAVFRKLRGFMERYLETDLMPLLVAGVAVGYAGLSTALGLSEVLGAFLAGIMVAEVLSSNRLEHTLQPVKSLTLPFFFFSFGTMVTFEADIKPLLPLLGSLVLWSLAAKALVGFYGGRSYGLSRRAALRAALSLGPRGEFSAIAAALALPPWPAFVAAYIICTTVAGAWLFYRAPVWAKRFFSSPSRPAGTSQGPSNNRSGLVL